MYVVCVDGVWFFGVCVVYGCFMEILEMKFDKEYDVFGFVCLLFIVKIKKVLVDMLVGQVLWVIFIDFGLVCDMVVFVE